jgi:hypothetical protein
LRPSVQKHADAPHAVALLRPRSERPLIALAEDVPGVTEVIDEMIPAY